MKTIVVSAVNLRKGGTLTVLRQCLEYLSHLSARGGYRIVALVHSQALADYSGIEYIEMPWTIRGWLRRLWCEYVTMGKVSQQLGEVDLWLSLHDTSPRVKARRQAVYCQSSFPFYPARWSDARYDYKTPLFAYVLRLSYRINIHSNRYLIAQQRWLCEGFHRMFGVARERMIHAPAPMELSVPAFVPIEPEVPYTFFYAATPDTHKEYQTLCRASQLLEERVGKGRFRTILTISGDENKYAEWIRAEWGSVSSIKMGGLLDKPMLYAHYALADCFVFPSRIETWGLPITEYMLTTEGKGRMILSDLPYAHETSAGAQRVAFCPPADAEALSRLMERALKGDDSIFSLVDSSPSPFRRADGWQALFDILLEDD